MHFFKKFMPDVFNILTIEEKKNIIDELTTYLCNDFNLEPIPVVLDNKLDKQNNPILGQLLYEKPFISINEAFITGDVETQKNIFNSYINLHVFIPYYLMHTIAHECYHYHQYDTVKKLVSERLTDENDINEASLNFVCLYSELLISLNSKINFSNRECPLSLNDLYRYSPCEVQAEAYASKITDILGKIDYKEYYKYYADLEVIDQLEFNKHNIDNGSNLIVKTIEYNLQLALDFLSYKNKTSGVKTNYLGLDPFVLEKSVKRILQAWSKKEKSETDFVKKLLKK